MALVAATIVLVAVFSSPFVGLLLLLGLIPFQSFLSFYFPPIGTVWMGAVIRDGLAAAVVLGWLLRRLAQRNAPTAMGWAEKLALVYIGVVALYIPAAPVLAGGATAFRNLVGYLVLLLISAELVNTQKRLRFVTNVVLTTAFVLALIGIAEVVTERDIFAYVGYDMVALMGPELPFTYLGVARATGGTGNPLEFGFYMAIAAVICIALLSARGPVRGASSVMVVLVVVLVALVLTFARSAYITFIVGGLGMAALGLKRRFLIALAALVLVGVLASYTPYAELLGPRLTLQDAPGIATAEQRLEIWKVVLSNAFSNWMGSGLGTQGAAVGRAHLDPYFNITDTYYGSILLQIGFFPLALFLGFLVVLARRFFALFHSLEDAGRRAFAAAALLIVLMVAVNSLFSSAFESRTLSITVWILLGSGLRLDRRQGATGGQAGGA